MIKTLLIAFISSFIGTLGFAPLLRAPRRSWFVSALLGGISYTVYELLMQLGAGSTMSSFIGTLVGTFLAHVFARRMKMIATIFIALSIIPCVPGLGLYHAMSQMASGQFSQGVQTGVSAMAAIIMMALAITISNYIFRLIHPIVKAPEH